MGTALATLQKCPTENSSRHLNLEILTFNYTHFFEVLTKPDVLNLQL